MKRLIFLLTLILTTVTSKLNAQNNWRPVSGCSPNGYMYSMQMNYDTLELSGPFTEINGIAIVNNAKYIPTQITIASPVLDNWANDIQSFQGAIYKTGLFHIVGIQYGVVKIQNGVVSGFNVPISNPYGKSLCINNGKLVIAVENIEAGSRVPYIYEYDGNILHSLPIAFKRITLGSLSSINVIESINDTLAIGGDFDSLNLVKTYGSGLWTGSRIIGMNLQQNSIINAIVPQYHNQSYWFGSLFATTNSVISYGIMRTKDSVFSAVGLRGVKLIPACATVWSGKLFFGGQKAFNPDPSIDVGNLGSWDGSNFYTESQGIFKLGIESINSLAVDTIRNIIYTSGNFQTSFGDSANFIAQKGLNLFLPINKINLSTRLLDQTKVNLYIDLDISGSPGTLYIEQSIDGINFSPIYFQSVTSSSRSVSYIDNVQSNISTLYYRAKVEQSGTVKYSEIRKIYLGKIKVDIASNGKTIFFRGNTVNARYSISNTLGQIVIQGSLNGEQQKEFSNLSHGGIYTIKFSQKGESLAKKIYIH